MVLLKGKDNCYKSLFTNSLLFSTIRKYSSSDSDKQYEKLIVNRTKSTPGVDYWNDFGYKYCGIIVLSFFKWIENQILKDGKNTIQYTKRTALIEKITQRIKNNLGATKIIRKETNASETIDGSVIIAVDETDCATIEDTAVQYRLLGRARAQCEESRA